ncbi:MAG TPA: L-fucose isomerase [Rhizomicrobium sp.]|nr:L-fucose isomerase [Rhizomicrobium sp.]
MNSVFSANLPKIGIRPTIDGRKGVRETLEAQTMQMARATAELIAANLKHPNGEPVSCVIADTTIGGVAEAAACADKFRRVNVGATITVTPCWCYGSETMDMDPLTPKAVWGFNGTERPGAVYLAAVLAAHNQKGLPAFGIYGRDVVDRNDARVPDDVKAKLLAFARSALAVAHMRGKSYLSMGGVSMGIAGSIVDQSFFQKYLGIRTECVDMSELQRRIQLGIYDHEEFAQALAWTRENCIEGRDFNGEAERHTPEQKRKEWEISVQMALIARDLMAGNPRLAAMGHGEESLGHNAILGGFQGQRQWTDFMPNGDFMETILNSSFDWNGPRAPYVLATENDCLNGVGMLFNYLLTAKAQIFSDVRTYWGPQSIARVTGWKPQGDAEGGVIHLINSGSTCLDATGEMQVDGKPAIKPFWDVTGADVRACMKATRFCPADVYYFRGGGFSTDFTTRGGMPLTMVRLNLLEGLGPVLQIAEGVSVSLPEEVHDKLDLRTSPAWPTTWFAPRLTGSGPFRSVYDVMGAWGANHGAISHGHIGAEVITLASMLRIPVAMHNVPAENLYRPSAWSMFGMDGEGADYRACATYGPLYG